MNPKFREVCPGFAQVSHTKPDLLHTTVRAQVYAASMSEPRQRSLTQSERERAVALARHLRDSEHRTIAQIAQRLGRAPSTVAGYLVDPAGERARRYNDKNRGRCECCGALTAAKPGVRLCRSCWRESVRSGDAQLRA